MNGIIRIDTYFLRVKTLLKDHEAMLSDLAKRKQQLHDDYNDIPAAVCLRPIPMDMQIIPGNPDPERKLWGNIQQIHREQRACKSEIRHVDGEIREIERLIAKTMRLEGQPGRVLRGLYIDGKTWDALQDDMGCARDTISHHRNNGIAKLAGRLYSRIKTDFEKRA